MKRTMLISVLVAGVFILTAQQVAAQTQAPTLQEADALYQAQQWAEAARAYAAITEADPSAGLAWYRLGFALNSLGSYAQGAEALRKAAGIGHRPEVMYALAHSYALMNDKDHAFEWLTKAVENGLPQPRQIKTDRNVINLRDDPRFQTLLALIERKARVCMNIPEYRQFDFWVGDWEVRTQQGQVVGSNSVKLLEDGCIVEENWTSAGDGQTGKSFNFYNPMTKKWHQSYMGNDAGNWMMDGEYKDGAMRLVGMIYSPRRQVMTRMTFFNLGPDKVRQLGEISEDAGANWKVTWDAIYLRKKPAPALTKE
jgi:tetratricopeptide (TPR) repeat protein